MSSSIGFFLGMTRLVRPRCSAPKILLNICKTSSDDLSKYRLRMKIQDYKHQKTRIETIQSTGRLLKVVRAVYIVDVIYGLL